MLGKIVFAGRRALFAQPLGMTVRTLAAKLRRRKVSAANGSAVHPIDARYGIDTGGTITASLLRTNKAADVQNFGYAPSQPSIIRAALATIPDLARFTFLDIGCGKGRALAVASEYPFRRIVGVELSGALCEVARANAAKIGAPIEIIEGDALAVPLPPGSLVIYLYNPFFDAFVRALARKIGDRKSDEPLFLIYYNPVCAKAFDDCPALVRFHAAKHVCDAEDAQSAAFGNRHDSVVIWQRAGPSMAASHPGADAPVRITASGVAAEVV